MISDRELERLLYPMSLSWLRATLSAAGLKIVSGEAFDRRAYQRELMRKRRSEKRAHSSGERT
jgi:hypothetical protein